MIDDSKKYVHDPLRRSGLQVEVSIPRQTLEIVRDGLIDRTYSISTSKFGSGFEPGSFRTPVGRFAVAEKFGFGAAPGTVFKARCPTGEIAEQGGEEDLILTRILWLKGLDLENANTKERFIYIHGTNQESRIGKPASCGCIRMRTADLIAVFDQIPLGCPVKISE